MSYNKNQKEHYLNNGASASLESTNNEYYSKTPSKRFSNSTPIQELNEAHRGRSGRSSVTQAVNLKRGRNRLIIFIFRKFSYKVMTNTKSSQSIQF